MENIKEILYLTGASFTILSFFYFIYHNSKKPDIELDLGLPLIDPRSSISPLFFDEEGYSQELELYVSIFNTGKKDAKSIELHLIFNKDILIKKYPENKKWGLKEFVNFHTFSYKSDSNIFPNNVSKSIGIFKIQIPEHNSEDHLLMTGQLKGDFKRKAFLVAYNYKEQRLFIEHYSGSTLNDGSLIWNARLHE